MQIHAIQWFEEFYLSLVDGDGDGDGDGDRATAGGETETTPSSREAFPGISWKACLGTDGTGGTVRGLCSEME